MNEVSVQQALGATALAEGPAEQMRGLSVVCFGFNHEMS